MEAGDAQEIQEDIEKARQDNSLRPVSFTMSLLAVLVAVTTVMGHRTHTQAVLAQARATDQWNLYQAKKIRQYSTGLNMDLLGVLAVRDPNAAKAITNVYKAHTSKWNDDLNEEQAEAKDLEGEVRTKERRANRFDLGEAMLEIGLVITSITLLTRQRTYWGLGLGFGVVGVVIVSWAFLIH